MVLVDEDTSMIIDYGRAESDVFDIKVFCTINQFTGIEKGLS